MRCKAVISVLLVCYVVQAAHLSDKAANQFIGSGDNAPEQYIDEPLPPEVTGGKQIKSGHTVTVHGAGSGLHSAHHKVARRKKNIASEFQSKLRWAVQHCSVDEHHPSPLVLDHGQGKCTSVRRGTPGAQIWNLDFKYDSCQNVSMVNTGNELRALGFQGFMDSNGVKYDLSHVDFKSPSDHVVDGKRFDLEMQLVHNKRPDQQSHGNDHLVVSLLFDRCPCGGLAAQTSRFFDGLKWERTKALRHLVVGKKLHYKHECADLNVFSKSFNGAYFAYEGVRNSPPCSDEVISWVVMTAKNGVYLETLAEIQAAFNGGNNGLAIEPAHGQTVTCFE